MSSPIYLDYAATTPVDPRVAEIMLQHLTDQGHFGNPGSVSHSFGRAALAAVDKARNQVAALINASPQEILWTSGATEANNLAIKGVANFYKEKGRHIITCKTEHKAVLDTCKYLEKNGFKITFLQPEANGLVNLEIFKAAIQKDTILAAIMHVNNEIGVVQDIVAIGEICRQHDIFFHVDAVQSAGKIPIDVQKLPVDLMSFSAHKIYGPKGIGALYLRSKPKVRLEPIIHGGGQEQGLRPGTLATHQIVGMGKAFELAGREMQQEMARLGKLRDRLWDGIKSIPEVAINGTMSARVANNLNIRISHVDGAALLMALKGIAVSTGSACTSASIEPSYVLTALGIDAKLAHSSLRITLGRYTTEEDIEFTVQHIREGISWLRSLSPLWKENVSV